jgi:hypothetical protein
MVTPPKLDSSRFSSSVLSQLCTTWVPQVRLNLKSVELAPPKQRQVTVQQKGRPARAGLFDVLNDNFLIN